MIPACSVRELWQNGAMSADNPANPVFDPKDFLKAVPHQPGVYRMLNEQGRILYVGKAKDLRNRVSSYFRRNIANSRTYALVKQIRGVEITVTNW